MDITTSEGHSPASAGSTKSKVKFLRNRLPYSNKEVAAIFKFMDENNWLIYMKGTLICKLISKLRVIYLLIRAFLILNLSIYIHL